MECISCRKPKGTLHCGICEEPICKSCVVKLAPDAFSFKLDLDESLKHLFYCGPCFDEVVAPMQEAYGEVLERAKEVYVFFISQRKPIPILSRAKFSVKVDACNDRDETILRLAFQAAEQNFNALMDTDVVAHMKRNEGYQTSIWTGEGRPANVDATKLEWYSRKDKRLMGDD